MLLIDYQPSGGPPVGPSANRIEAGEVYTKTGAHPYETAQALTKQDIKRIAGEYAQAARNAIEAGGFQTEGTTAVAQATTLQPA